MALLAQLLIIAVSLQLAVCRRCVPLYYATNGAKCGDDTRVDGVYCGVGKCSFFGISCQGGCRDVTHMAPIKEGDVILCNHKGRWRGSLALNTTHVVYPVYHKGFTMAVNTLKGAADSYVGHHCRVETQLFDHYASIFGLAPRPLSLSRYEIDVYSRNWEYQITRWKYGKSFSPAELVHVVGRFYK